MRMRHGSLASSRASIRSGTGDVLGGEGTKTINPMKMQTAVDRVEYGKRLIQEARLARIEAQRTGFVRDDEVDRTRTASEQAGSGSA